MSALSTTDGRNVKIERKSRQNRVCWGSFFLSKTLTLCEASSTSGTLVAILVVILIIITRASGDVGSLRHMIIGIFCIVCLIITLVCELIEGFGVIFMMLWQFKLTQCREGGLGLKSQKLATSLTYSRPWTGHWT